MMMGLENLSYTEKLKALGLLSIKRRRLSIDLTKHKGGLRVLKDESRHVLVVPSKSTRDNGSIYSRETNAVFQLQEYQILLP